MTVDKKPKKSPVLELNKFIASKLDDKKENFKIFKSFGSIREYISLGNYLLNAQLSGSLFKGLPNTRSLELAGKSGTGKTFLCLNMVMDEIEKGYHVYYIDTEGAIDDEDLANFGIDADCITHIRTIKTYEKCIEFINNHIKGYNDMTNDAGEDGELPKIALFVDSIGMMNTQAALDNALKGKYAEDMGKRAKIVRELFRNVTLDLSNLGIPFVFTNHTADSLDLFAIDREVTSSGEGPTFAASFITLLGKANYMREENDDKTKKKTGVILRAKSHKNRKVVPVEVKFHLSFKKGMNPYVGLEEFLSWDNCGVDFGTVLPKEEYDKKYSKTPPMNSNKQLLRVETWKNKNGEDWYAILNPNSRTLAVKGSCKTESPDDVYSDKIFTHETLLELDEKVIGPMFKYSSADETAGEILNMVSSSIKKVDDKVE